MILCVCTIRFGWVGKGKDRGTEILSRDKKRIWMVGEWKGKGQRYLTLLRSERPKLHTILAFPSAIGLK